MIILRIKTTQLQPHVTNWKGQMTMFVNDKYTKGLKYGALITTETGTADGEDKAVLRYAGTQSATYTDIAETSITLPAKKANGILFESSARDQYASMIDLSNEDRMYPYGVRQYQPIAMITDAVYEITDTEDVMKNSFYFRSVDKVLVTGTEAVPAIFVNASKTIELDGTILGIRVGEKIGTSAVTTYVTDVTYAAGKTIITTLAGLGNVSVETKLLSTMFDDLYSAPDMNGEVPFQLIPNGDKIGKVASGIAAHIKI